MTGEPTPAQALVYAHDLLRSRAEEDPDAELVTFICNDARPPRSLTSGGLWDAARRFAGGLSGLGVRRGDRVALLADNGPEFLIAWFGTLAHGAVAVPLNTALRGDLLEYALERSSAEVLVVAAELLEPVHAALDRVDGDVRLVCIPDGAALAGEVRFDEMLAEPLGPADGIAPDELAMILFTSGTTGPAKGIMLSHSYMDGFARMAQWVMAYEASDVSFTCLPLFHGNALLTTFLPTVRAGGRVVISPRFSASRFWAQIQATEATTTSLLGSMTPILQARRPGPEERDHKLRIALVIPPPQDGIDAFETRFGVPATELYGQADCSIPVGVPYGAARPAGACGIESPDWECRLLDSDLNEVAPGDIGELFVRPRRHSIAMLGYWRNPEATVAVWQDLWQRTGDLLRRDEDGWFRFVGRVKDAIRRFGENVSAYEVEQVLLDHPAISDAAVYGVPAEWLEEEVMATLIPAPDAELDLPDVLRHCEARLPYFAVPRYYDVGDRLPMTANHKVMKDALRERGVSATTWDSGPRGRKARQAAT